MKKAENFTVLELWNERGFPDIHLLLTYAGNSIAKSYKDQYNIIPKKIKVNEGDHGTFKVNQYPESFKKEVNIILDWVQAKYKNQYPELESKKKQVRVKRPRIKITNKLRKRE